MRGREQLCLALDFSHGRTALDWVERTRSVFGVYKVGLELFCAEGPAFLHQVRDAGAQKIFLDLKLHDIPRTVARAIHQLAPLGADYLTVHTSGGPAMLEAAVDAAKTVELQLLSVTVLTSLNHADLNAVGVSTPPLETVLTRGRLSMNCGVDGLVCSPREVAQLREGLGSGAFLVTPGIRLASGDQGDQKRVSTPRAALASGADLLVVGRAVTAASNPEEAMAAFAEVVGL